MRSPAISEVKGERPTGGEIRQRSESPSERISPGPMDGFEDCAAQPVTGSPLDSIIRKYSTEPIGWD